MLCTVQRRTARRHFHHVAAVAAMVGIFGTSGAPAATANAHPPHSDHTSSAEAQDASSTQPKLTADALVADVLRANPGIDAARSALQAAEARIGPAGTLDDPRLRYAIAPASIGVTGLDTGHIIGISQRLPWPGKREQRRDVARADQAAVQADLETTQRQAAAAARIAYAAWRYSHQAIDSNRRQQAVLAELADTASGLYRAGAGSQSDVLAADLRRAQRQRQALNLARDQAALTARINALRRAPVRQALGRPAPARMPPPLPEWQTLQAALDSNHPALARLAAVRQKADARAALARSDKRPDFEVTANYLGTLPRAENRAQVGIGINLPFGLGGRAKRAANLSIAEAEQARARALAADRRAQLSEQLAAAVANDTNARAEAALLDARLIPLARQTLEASLADYASGSGSADAVLNAESDLLDARLALARTDADALRARARIDALTGGSLTPTLFGQSQ